MAARSAIANCCGALSVSNESAPRLPVSVSDWIEKDEQSILFTKNISDNCKIHANSMVSEDQLVEPCVPLSLFQTDSSSDAASHNQNQLWNQMLLSGSEGVCHMEGNLYDVISSRVLMRSSELLDQKCDLVPKNQDSPAPFWDFSNISSFQGEDFTSSTQKQTLVPFPYTSNNYTAADMKNWCATPQKHGLHRSMQLNLSNQRNMAADYILRSGLDYPMANFDLEMSKEDVKCSPVTCETYNNIGRLETRMKPLKSNIGDDIGRPCYTGTVLAVEGYNVNPFRWQFSSFNKPASYFPSTKTQSQHHQRTAGKVQYRDLKNGMNTKRRTIDTTYHDAIFKRPRLDSSSPPTKAKFGDRITALQQLVSPFGKTDAASVLLETITYIKKLHDQVQVLSDPYMNSKGTFQGDHKCWGQYDLRNEMKESRLDLKSKGLCLVPLPSTASF